MFSVFVVDNVCHNMNCVVVLSKFFTLVQGVFLTLLLLGKWQGGYGFKFAGATTALKCLEGNGEGAEENLEILNSLMTDSCFKYDDYDVSHGRYPQGMRFTPEQLRCLSAVPHLTACTSCYLCHYYLDRKHSIAAYKSALMSLEYYPLAGPSVSCLAALYFENNNFQRAAFYAAGKPFRLVML